jgi:hTAFII28-like protein conserved region
MSGTTGGGGGKRSRGRPKKRKSQPHDMQTGRGGGTGEDDDGASTILSGLDNNNQNLSRGRRGATKSIISGTGPTNSADNAAAAAVDDDDDDAPVADPNSDEARRMEAESKQDKEKIAILVAALAPEQMDRYLSFSRTKLKMPTLKRIVNQTVIQSVTAGPLSAVQWMGKVFVGEMVELARDVREEWAVGWEKAREEERERSEREEAGRAIGLGYGAED